MTTITPKAVLDKAQEQFGITGEIEDALSWRDSSGMYISIATTSYDEVLTSSSLGMDGEMDTVVAIASVYLIAVDNDSFLLKYIWTDSLTQDFVYTSKPILKSSWGYVANSLYAYDANADGLKEIYCVFGDTLGKIEHGFYVFFDNRLTTQINYSTLKPFFGIDEYSSHANEFPSDFLILKCMYEKYFGRYPKEEH
ncbi:MAG: hypothetical protein AB7H80_06870 [Candidatus Kapaibacterium sp.]